MTFRIEKPGEYWMRGGGKAVVNEIFGDRAYGRYLGGEGNWRSMDWAALNGRCVYIREAHGDIIGPWVEPRKPVEGWVNVYRNGDAGLHPTKSEADRRSVHDRNRIACVYVRECEPPEDAS